MLTQRLIKVQYYPLIVPKHNMKTFKLYTWHLSCLTLVGNNFFSCADLVFKIHEFLNCMTNISSYHILFGFFVTDKVVSRGNRDIICISFVSFFFFLTLSYATFGGHGCTHLIHEQKHRRDPIGWRQSSTFRLVRFRLSLIGNWCCYLGWDRIVFLNNFFYWKYNTQSVKLAESSENENIHIASQSRTWPAPSKPIYAHLSQYPSSL